MHNDNGDRNGLLRAQTRDWQLWSIGVLAVGLVGVGLAFHAVWTGGPIDAASLLPPILYGIICLLVLFHFYLAQKQAILHGIREELIKQKIEAELNRELALLDPITEVYNRRYLRVVLRKEVSRAKRYGSPLSVMVLDIVGFRKVNASLGHGGGDVVLREVAHLLRNGTRNSDILVRYGGDEFLVILPDTEQEGASTLVRRFKEALVEWSRSSGMTEFQLQLAIGVAGYVPDNRPDELLQIAEKAMHEDAEMIKKAQSAGSRA